MFEYFTVIRNNNVKIQLFVAQLNKNGYFHSVYLNFNIILNGDLAFKSIKLN